MFSACRGKITGFFFEKMMGKSCKIATYAVY